ncbi:MAG: AGE family epimerase/isomerase [Lachnospiraceae bacterium]|nr:AGE family epimerase/isomerase [Candidatus Colinaster scatohippi]
MNYSKDYFRKHLQEKILPFWSRLEDKENGGFYGYMDVNHNLDKKADKGMILNSRILWFYANCFLTLSDDPNRGEYLRLAKVAYDFLIVHGFDRENPGIYWMVTCDGEASDSTKHSYNQAFAIYALSSYYDASKDADALRKALELYHLLEDTCFKGDGYEEAYLRDYSGLVENDKLSENGVIATRTMNTLLHIWEAYTELYRVLDKKGDEASMVAKSMNTILRIFIEKVYSEGNRRLEVFFDDEYNSLIDLYSYGHDIEASWLLNRGIDVLGEATDSNLKTKTEEIIDVLISHVYEQGYDKIRHATMAECENGIDAIQKIWWVQAESIIGFTNGYSRNSGIVEYKQAASDIWEFTLGNIVDASPEGEWFQEKDSPEGEKFPMVSPWKCPYHNGRMCLEMINRLG